MHSLLHNVLHIIPFTGVTTDKIYKLLSPDTNCDVDHIPTTLETMFSYTSHNHEQCQFVYLYWHFSLSIQKHRYLNKSNI